MPLTAVPLTVSAVPHPGPLARTSARPPSVPVPPELRSRRGPSSLPPPAVQGASLLAPTARRLPLVPAGPGRRGPLGDTGSAVAEFVLVAVVLVALFLAILQLGLALHVRNTLVASAAEGARYAANADRSPDEGADHARTVISSALSPRFAERVSGGYEEHLGVPTVVVEVRASLPVIGFLGPRTLVVRGHAVDEGAS